MDNKAFLINRYINSLKPMKDISRRVRLKMLRITTFCAFLALAILETGAFDGMKAGPPTSTAFALKLRTVQQARDLLDRRLVEQDYSVLNPALQYLLVLGVVYGAAYNRLCQPGSTQLVLLSSLKEELPEVLQNPNKTVLNVQDTLENTLNKLQPLSDVVANVCDGVADNECDRQVNALIRQDPVLLKSASYLDSASEVAYGLVSKDQRVEEVAKSLDVIPYLVDNVDDVADYVDVLSDFLRKVDDVSPCNVL